MKIVAAALLVCLAAIALVPAVFASHLPTTGTQLNLIRLGRCSAHNPDIRPADATFAANADFFVRHGWVLPWRDITPEERQASLSEATRFDLFVDGVQVSSMNDFNFDDSFVKTFLTNFPGGMTGTHTFRGQWFLDGFFVGETPGTAVFQLACAVRVQFA